MKRLIITLYFEMFELEMYYKIKRRLQSVSYNKLQKEKKMSQKD